jgi:uncharacterized protein (TIGR03086 family)
MSFVSTDSLASALAAARDELTRVNTERLASPTPCRSWDVRGLVNHMVGAPRVAASRVGGKEIPDDEDFAAGDFVGSHDETSKVVLAAFGSPGALEREIQFPFGERPAGFLMFFVATDQLAHAWDLARVSGDSTDISPDLAVELLEEARGMVTSEMRGADGESAFGPEQVAPKGASAADSLAAFLGRTV